MECRRGVNCTFLHSFGKEKKENKQSINMVRVETDNTYLNDYSNDVRNNEIEQIIQNENQMNFRSNFREEMEEVLQENESTANNEQMNICTIRAEEENTSNDKSRPEKEYKKNMEYITDKLTKEQQIQLQPIFDCDPSIKEIYNKAIINKLKFEEKEKYKLKENELKLRIKELENDKDFQDLKARIENSAVRTKESLKSRPMIQNIFSDKLDGSYKVCITFEENKKGNYEECMIDSGSGINIISKSAAIKYEEHIKLRTKSFMAEVADGNSIKLRAYVQLRINDPLNLNAQNRNIHTRFYVLEKSPYKFIIGRILMKKLGFQIIHNRQLLAYVHKAKNIRDLVDINSKNFQALDYNIGKPDNVRITINAIKERKLHMKVGEFNNNEARALFERVLLSFADVFSMNGEIGEHPKKMDIKLKVEAVGFHDKQYPMSYEKVQKMEIEIQDLLKNGIIIKCEPDEELMYVSTAFLVSGGHKAMDSNGNTVKGKDRMVINYSFINLWTKRHPYLIPMIDDLLKRLFGMDRFLSLDIKKGFYHMKLTESASKLTAFRCPSGIYRFTRCPFGLINCPAQFQMRMENALGSVVPVYIDDILGGVPDNRMRECTNEEEVELKLVKLLIKILKRLRKINTKLGMSKCAFNQREIEFLGRMVTADGLRMAKKQKSAILKCKIPKNKNELASFLGLINTMSGQMPYLADYIQIFQQIRKQKSKYRWEEVHQSAFEALKHMTSTIPFLFHPDLTEKGGRFWVFSDCSGVALGGALMQERGQSLVPVSFHSRLLRENEKSWHIQEQEMQGIIDNITHWYKILQPRLFIVITDHENLMNVLNWARRMRTRNTRLQIQVTQISQFNFICLYKPGKHLPTADYLSRCIDHDIRNEHNKESKIELKKELKLRSYGKWEEFKDKFNSEMFDGFINKIPMKFEEEKGWINIENYKSYEKVKERKTCAIKRICSIKNIIQSHQKLKELQDENRNISRCLTVKEKHSIINEKLGKKAVSIAVIQLPTMNEDYEQTQKYITDGITREIMKINKISVNQIKDKQREDIVCGAIVRYIENRNEYWIIPLPQRIRVLALQGKFKIREDGILMTTEEQIYIPYSLVPTFIHYFHSSTFMQHQGCNRTLAVIKERYFWPRMEKEITDYGENCHYCQSIKSTREYNRYTVSDYTPDEANMMISMDSVGPLPEDIHGFRYYSTIKDMYDKYLVIIPHKNIQGPTLARTILDSWIYVFGAPKKILLDNGSGYNEDFVKCIIHCFAIKDVRISAGNPKCNGANEKSHQFITQRLAINGEIERHERAKDGVYHENWSEDLKAIQFAYNNTPNRMTNKSPNELRFGKSMSLPIDNILGMKIREVMESKSYNGSMNKRKYEMYFNTIKEQLKLVNKQARIQLEKYITQKISQQHKKTKEDEIKPDTEVMLWIKHKQGNERKMRAKWEAGYLILKMMKNGVTYKVINKKSGKTRNEHRDNIRRYNCGIERLNNRNEKSAMKEYFNEVVI